MSVLGLNELLRLFFSQKEQQSFAGNSINFNNDLDEDIREKVNDFKNFAEDYQDYYFDKYENKETGVKPYKRFLRLINDIPFDTTKFLYWFREAVENTNDYLLTKKLVSSEKWSDELIYNHNGGFAITFAKLAIKFSLLKQYQESFLEQNQKINS